jgi:hypothetical protein
MLIAAAAEPVVPKVGKSERRFSNVWKLQSLAAFA